MDKQGHFAQYSENLLGTVIYGTSPHDPNRTQLRFLELVNMFQKLNHLYFLIDHNTGKFQIYSKNLHFVKNLKLDNQLHITDKKHPSHCDIINTIPQCLFDISLTLD